MKKEILSFALALLCIFSFGQTVQKGNLLGLHTFTPNLENGLTMQDYANFYMNKWIPAVEKAFPGAKAYFLKSIRGDDSSSLGILIIFRNEADRNKYWTTSGTLTTAGEAANKMLTDKVGKEQEKYAAPSSNSVSKYNDWVIQ